MRSVPGGWNRKETEAPFLPAENQQFERTTFLRPHFEYVLNIGFDFWNLVLKALEHCNLETVVLF